MFSLLCHVTVILTNNIVWEMIISIAFEIWCISNFVFKTSASNVTTKTSAMGKASSKLRKNWNYTDTSLYQIYLLKLHENILKPYRLDLFKEITIDFKRDLNMTSKFPASLYKVLPVWIDRYCRYPCLQSIIGSSSIHQFQALLCCVWTM